MNNVNDADVGHINLKFNLYINYAIKFYLK